MFVPRSVRQKPVAKPKLPVRKEATPEKEQEDETEEDSEEIVKLSKHQRWPAPDEPSCIVCGKYGAYICDSTDQDVCSVECKMKHLESVTSNKSCDLEGYEEIGIFQRTEQSSESEILGSSSLSLNCYMKYVYREHPDLEEMTEAQTQKLRQAVICLRVCPSLFCLCVVI
jgi:ATP-dependent RNA helicase DDX59